MEFSGALAGEMEDLAMKCGKGRVHLGRIQECCDFNYSNLKILWKLTSILLMISIKALRETLIFMLFFLLRNF